MFNAGFYNGMKPESCLALAPLWSLNLQDAKRSRTCQGELQSHFCADSLTDHCSSESGPTMVEPSGGIGLVLGDLGTQDAIWVCQINILNRIANPDHSLFLILDESFVNPRRFFGKPTPGFLNP
jgi:hypothetical protein